jgi:hypothetical protein
MFQMGLCTYGYSCSLCWCLLLTLYWQAVNSYLTVYYEAKFATGFLPK